MKLEVIKRDVSEIVVSDDQVLVAMELQISHGRVKKSVTPVTVEHAVMIAALLPGADDTGVADAMVMAVAGVNRRADEAIAALGGLTEL